MLPVAAALLTACANGNDFLYKLYPGPERPDSELATLTLDGNVYHATIDGLYVQRLDYSVVKLRPGEHTITYGAVFGTSYLVNAEMEDRIETTETFEMLAGRNYILKSDRTYGPGYVMSIWIEAVPAGEVP
jgi:hypothetical protein